jgi:hypothetical protein
MKSQKRWAGSLALRKCTQKTKNQNVTPVAANNPHLNALRRHSANAGGLLAIDTNHTKRSGISAGKRKPNTSRKTSKL